MGRGGRGKRGRRVVGGAFFELLGRRGVFISVFCFEWAWRSIGSGGYISALLFLVDIYAYNDETLIPLAVDEHMYIQQLNQDGQTLGSCMYGRESRKIRKL